MVQSDEKRLKVEVVSFKLIVFIIILSIKSSYVALNWIHLHGCIFTHQKKEKKRLLTKFLVSLVCKTTEVLLRLDREIKVSTICYVFTIVS